MFEKLWQYMKKVTQWATHKPAEAIETGVISTLTAIGATAVLYLIVPVTALATASGVLGGTLIGVRLINRGLNDYSREQEQTLLALSATQIANLQADIDIQNARLYALTTTAEENNKIIQELQRRREQELEQNLNAELHGAPSLNNSPIIAVENPIVTQGMFSRSEVKHRRAPAAVSLSSNVNANY
ncbi:MAG: hypothetical protein BGO90_14785 [Legionella sp. 40-6]|nr:hypothetical protein [Legionella sp.]OJY26549.1 MAG: hypothetical protein BGO90_14785 [Legionella sp. 40-6]